MSLKPAVNSKENFKGGKNASVEIVEYGDYECPNCGEAHPIIEEILATFGEQIKFVFRNFPLSELHPYAKAAALAAEAANLQGKFWEMHDAIFEQQNELDVAFLFVLGQEIGLNVSQLKADMQAENIIEKVESDFESGMRSGVNGTPTFFVNGERFDGGASDLFEMLKESAQ